MMDDLGPLPKVHPRHIPVERARQELLSFSIDWSQKHGLTRAEELLLLADRVEYLVSSAVKAERKETSPD